MTPIDGQADVPANTVLVVRGQFLPETTTLRLTNLATGTDVSLALERVGDVFIGRPPDRLAANTTHELAVTTFPGNDVRIGFTTGDAMDDMPPGVPEIATLALETQAYPAPGSNCSSSCVEGGDRQVERLRVTWTADPDVAWLQLEVRRAAETLPFYTASIVPGDWMAGVFGWHSCGPRAPRLDPEGMYCARLIGRDAAGNEAVGAEVCAVAATCAPIDVDCAPADGCASFPDTSPPDPDGCRVAMHSRRAPVLLVVLALLVGGLWRRRGR